VTLKATIFLTCVFDVLESVMARREKEVLKAQNWLRGRLSGGPQLARSIRDSIETEGFSFKTLCKAKTILGVKSRQARTGWFWVLPEAPGDLVATPPAVLDSQTNRALPRPYNPYGSILTDFPDDGPETPEPEPIVDPAERKRQVRAWTVSRIKLWEVQNPEEVLEGLSYSEILDVQTTMRENEEQIPKPLLDNLLALARSIRKRRA
jgi:hypothetical protein